MRTALYRLIPTARRDDPSWGRAQWQGEILVRARSSGEARALAARAEAAAAGAAPLTTTVALASAFLDAGLYGVRRAEHPNFTAVGALGVVAGGFEFPAGAPVPHVD